MSDFNKWVASKEDVDYMYGGETISISNADIRKLRTGWLYNFSVNDEYGCVLQYEGSKAHWISIPNAVGSPDLVCSECNEHYYPSFTRPTYPFCPWCGADMNGGTIK